jgi:L-fucose isomerase-like protein
MMTGPSPVTDHGIIMNSMGPGHAYGCHVGRIRPGEFTFGNLATSQGELSFYLGEGVFTGETIPEDFFGVAGVAEIPGLQDVLLHIGWTGHRHHVAVTGGCVQAAVYEALDNYLGWHVTLPQ